MNSLIIIKTTVKNKEVKKKILNAIITNKLAACVNVIENISSCYMWRDKIIEDKEDILFIKTLSNNEKEVYQIIKKHHDYEIPEIITIEVKNAEMNYLDWVNKTITKSLL